MEDFDLNIDVRPLEGDELIVLRVDIDGRPSPTGEFLQVRLPENCRHLPEKMGAKIRLVQSWDSDISQRIILDAPPAKVWRNQANYNEYELSVAVWRVVNKIMTRDIGTWVGWEVEGVFDTFAIIGVDGRFYRANYLYNGIPPRSEWEDVTQAWLDNNL